MKSAVRIFLAAAMLQITFQRSSPFSIVLGVVQPAILTGMLILTRRDLPMSEATLAAVSASLTSLWALTVWSGGGILRNELRFGTLGRLVIAPTDVRLVLLGKTAGGAILNMALVSISSAVVLIVAGVTPRVTDPSLLILATGLTLLSAIGLSLVLACIFVLTRAAARISEALTYPVFLFGGLMIPVTSLPEGLQWPASLMSLRWARELIGTSLGSSGRGDPVAFAWLAALATVYLVVGWLLFERVLDRSRATGRLEFM